MVSCQKGSFRKKASPYKGQRNKHCYLSPATWVESKGYIMEEAREPRRYRLHCEPGSQPLGDELAAFQACGREVLSPQWAHQPPLFDY